MNRSECIAPVNSGRPITNAVLSGRISYLAVYDDRTVTMTGSASATCGRQTFPRNGAETTPGAGQFFIAQACCCQCRSTFIFNDQTYAGLPESAGVIAVEFTLTVTTQNTDDEGNPTDDPPDVEELPRLFFVNLWNKADAPCRDAAGPKNNPIARLYVPQDPLDVFAPVPDPETHVSGSYGAIFDQSGAAPVVGYEPILFQTPEPCSNAQDFTASITKNWNEDSVTANAAISFTLAMS